MQQTKNTLEELVKSYFTTKIKTKQSTNKEYFFIHISQDDKDLFPIKIAIPVETVINYSEATTDQQNVFNNKLEKFINSRNYKFSEDVKVFPVKFDITH